MRVIRERLTYANVVATLALVLALGGVSYAATKLPKNSVGTKQIKKGAVTSAKVKKHTLTGNNINLNKLGTVPAAKTADTANGLSAPEAFRIVGSAGQPPFLDGTFNFPPEQGVTFRPVGFYKDHEGVVHLEGMAKAGEGENPIEGLLFQLPPGYRPAVGSDLVFPNVENEETISVLGSNVVSNGHNLEGDVVANGGKGTIVTLNGITFRAES
jgi:hypothetical protein